MEPGDEIKTCIRYDHETGSITVSIAIMKETKKGDGRDNVTKIEDSDRRSEIVVDRPFPHTLVSKAGRTSLKSVSVPSVK